jgi:hypothetical protein
MLEGKDAIRIGQARLWRDLGPGITRSDQSASWFRVSNMPEGLEADLFWVTGKQWAFIFRGRGTSYMSKGIYSSKECALEGLKKWLQENEPKIGTEFRSLRSLSCPAD